MSTSNVTRHRIQKCERCRRLRRKCTWGPSRKDWTLQTADAQWLAQGCNECKETENQASCRGVLPALDIRTNVTATSVMYLPEDPMSNATPGTIVPVPSLPRLNPSIPALAVTQDSIYTSIGFQETPVMPLGWPFGPGGVSGQIVDGKFDGLNTSDFYSFQPGLTSNGQIINQPLIDQNMASLSSQIPITRENNPSTPEIHFSYKETSGPASDSDGMASATASTAKGSFSTPTPTGENLSSPQARPPMLDPEQPAPFGVAQYPKAYTLIPSDTSLHHLPTISNGGGITNLAGMPAVKPQVPPRPADKTARIAVSRDKTARAATNIPPMGQSSAAFEAFGFSNEETHGSPRPEAQNPDLYDPVAGGTYSQVQFDTNCERQHPKSQSILGDGRRIYTAMSGTGGFLPMSTVSRSGRLTASLGVPAHIAGIKHNFDSAWNELNAIRGDNIRAQVQLWDMLIKLALEFATSGHHHFASAIANVVGLTRPPLPSRAPIPHIAPGTAYGRPNKKRGFDEMQAPRDHDQ